MMKIKPTAPLTIGEGINKVRLTRRFLGNLFPDNCYERKELAAYIKGHEFFNYKRDDAGYPMRFKVRQEYFYA